MPFCLRKKRPENVFLTLIVNYRKIVQKNKLCHPKQQQIDYLMTYDVIYSLLVLIEKFSLNMNSVLRKTYYEILVLLMTLETLSFWTS